MRHIRVLWKKGMTGYFYLPKNQGISATPTKAMSGSYTPNYVPFNYMANHPTEQVASTLVQGGPWSPVRYAQYTPPKLGSTSAVIRPRGGLLENYPATQGPSGHTPYANGQGYTARSNHSVGAVPQFSSPVQGKQSLIVITLTKKWLMMNYLNILKMMRRVTQMQIQVPQQARTNPKGNILKRNIISVL